MTEDQFEQFSEVLKVSIPFVTFFLGVLFTWIFKIRDERKAINNMKNVLFLELYFNGIILNSAFGLANEEVDDERFAYIKYCGLVDHLETLFFERYLDRVNQLRKDETNIVIFAYQSTKKAKRDANDYIEFLKAEIIGKEDKDIPDRIHGQLAKRGDLLIGEIFNAYEKTYYALYELSRGRRDLVKKFDKFNEGNEFYYLLKDSPWKMKLKEWFRKVTNTDNPLTGK